MNKLLAITVNSPHIHWPALSGAFLGGVIVGMILMGIIVHRSRFL